MNETKFEKFGLVQKSAGVTPDLEKINAQTRVPLKAEDVCIFRIAACDDRVDRDHERFTVECLRELAPMFIGRPVLMDHQWSATTQTARVYDAAVEQLGEDHRLVLYCYLPVTESARDTIIAINAGILREVSVGCAVGKAACSICGADKTKTRCEHRPGQTYDGRECIVELSEPKDAYEVSFVAVPAQPKAGVVKQYGGEDDVSNLDTSGTAAEKQKALALLELAEYA